MLEGLGYRRLVECVLERGGRDEIGGEMKDMGDGVFMEERYGGREIVRGEGSRR